MQMFIDTRSEPEIPFIRGAHSCINLSSLFDVYIHECEYGGTSWEIAINVITPTKIEDMR